MHPLPQTPFRPWWNQYSDLYILWGRFFSLYPLVTIGCWVLLTFDASISVCPSMCSIKDFQKTVHNLPSWARYGMSFVSSLQWRHNERDVVSNIQPHDCLLKRLFRCKSKNIKALRHWPLCGEFTGDRWIPRTKGPVTQKMFPFDDIIMSKSDHSSWISVCRVSHK